MNKITFASIGAVVVIAGILFLGVTGVSATITNQLGIGSRGSQVSQLQEFLATNSFVYPAGLVTGYYGPMTSAAVRQFQLAYGIPQVGVVGPQTLAQINAVMNNGFGLDLSAPIMSHPSVQVNGNSVTISWSTNEFARGKVVYGTSPVILGNTFDTTGVSFVEPTVVSGSVAPYDGVYRTSQSITINGLAPHTMYYYVVMSIDASTNVSLTNPATFYIN